MMDREQIVTKNQDAAASAVSYGVRKNVEQLMADVEAQENMGMGGVMKVNMTLEVTRFSETSWRFQLAGVSWERRMKFIDREFAPVDMDASQLEIDFKKADARECTNSNWRVINRQLLEEFAINYFSYLTGIAYKAGLECICAHPRWAGYAKDKWAGNIYEYKAGEPAEHRLVAVPDNSASYREVLQACEDAGAVVFGEHGLTPNSVKLLCEKFDLIEYKRVYQGEDGYLYMRRMEPEGKVLSEDFLGSLSSYWQTLSEGAKHILEGWGPQLFYLFDVALL